MTRTTAFARFENGLLRDGLRGELRGLPAS
jgi:hypothetical protein